jgi:hypothetical protein
VHAAPADQATALRLSRHATEITPKLAERLGVPTGGTVDVYLAPDEPTFRLAAAGHDSGLGGWHGVADARARLPALAADSRRNRNGSHAGLRSRDGARAARSRVRAEARPASGSRKASRRSSPASTPPAICKRSRTECSAGKLLTLPELTGAFPDDPVRASLAYAQSADLVAYIVGHYGEDALGTLVQEMSHGTSFGRALRLATGIGPTELDQAWRARLAQSPLWVRAVASDTMLMTAARSSSSSGGGPSGAATA